ncbi:hypothetical protein D3C86_1936340 [compost metagenome]
MQPRKSQIVYVQAHGHVPIVAKARNIIEQVSVHKVREQRTNAAAGRKVAICGTQRRQVLRHIVGAPQIEVKKPLNVPVGGAFEEFSYIYRYHCPLKAGVGTGISHMRASLSRRM